MAISGTSTQMESVVLGWFVLTLTDSPFLVGLIASARMALNWLALFSGAIADRVSKQRLLAVVEFSQTALALLMLTLILTGTLQLWHIFALTVTGGFVRTFQMPASQSLVADSLREDLISNGAALTNMGRNINSIMGPLLGGFLFGLYGPQGAYAVISVLTCMSGLCALLITTVRATSRIDEQSVLRSILEGLKYVKGQQVLWGVLVLAVIINFTGWPLHTNLMPIFARDVLGTDSAGLGLLLSAFGVGALVGSMSFASVRNLASPGKLLIIAVLAWHGSMVLFAVSTSFYLSMAILALVGMAFSSTQVMMLTLILRTTLPEFRGRVVGLRTLAIYAYTFGSANSGAVAGAMGAPLASAFNGVAGVVLLGLLAVVTPKLRRA